MTVTATGYRKSIGGTAANALSHSRQAKAESLEINSDGQRPSD